MPTKIRTENQVGRRLKLRDLHVFFTVVQCGSMARAAGQLGVSQPTVSEVIADLEHTFGVRLLDRRPQGVEPTMYGAALFRRSVAAFDELKQSSRDIEFLADPTAGELQIGCPDSIAASVLPSFIKHFRSQHPRVVMHVSTVPPPAVRSLGLRDRKYDLILAWQATSLPDDLADELNMEGLFNDRLVLAAGMHTRWARWRKIDLAELVGESWILNEPTAWSYSRVVQEFRARGLDMPTASLVTPSFPLIMHFVANGEFITACPRSVAHLSALKELSADLPSWPWPVVILTLKNRTLSPVAERFIQCAREAAKPLAAGAGKLPFHGKEA